MAALDDDIVNWLKKSTENLMTRSAQTKKKKELKHNSSEN